MRRLTTLALTTATAALALAPAANAHQLPRKHAVKAAKAQAQKIARTTNARSFTLGACERQSRHAWSCTATFQYPKDEAYCEVPIEASYRKRNHKSRKLRRDIGATVCY